MVLLSSDSNVIGSDTHDILHHSNLFFLLFQQGPLFNVKLQINQHVFPPCFLHPLRVISRSIGRLQEGNPVGILLQKVFLPERTADGAAPLAGGGKPASLFFYETHDLQIVLRFIAGGLQVAENGQSRHNAGGPVIAPSVPHRIDVGPQQDGPAAPPGQAPVDISQHIFAPLQAGLFNPAPEHPMSYAVLFRIAGPPDFPVYFGALSQFRQMPLNPLAVLHPTHGNPHRFLDVAAQMVRLYSCSIFNVIMAGPMPSVT